MGINLKEVVKPSDFDLSSRLGGSTLNKMEKEIVASNVIAICKENNDAWLDFNFKDYVRLCGDSGYGGHESILDNLAEHHCILDKKDGVYSVNERFFRTLAVHIKTAEEVPVGV
jgi:hypothetical protein